MVASRNNIAAFISTACVLILANLNGCDAWTTNNNNHVRIPRSSSDSITTTTSAPAVAAPSLDSVATISFTTDDKLNLRQRQKLLQSALSHARKTDQKFGLSAPESIYAWSIVDELYAAIPEYSSAVEESVRKVFGEKKSIWDR
ncbi:hypothetical protein ACHAWT_001443 [Skeletonema menzelii]|eukprot:scaffold932_cov139-Skeletonema_menzelii.AAC.15